MRINYFNDFLFQMQSSEFAVVRVCKIYESGIYCVSWQTGQDSLHLTDIGGSLSRNCCLFEFSLWHFATTSQHLINIHETISWSIINVYVFSFCAKLMHGLELHHQQQFNFWPIPPGVQYVRFWFWVLKIPQDNFTDMIRCSK